MKTLAYVSGAMMFFLLGCTTVRDDKSGYRDAAAVHNRAVEKARELEKTIEEAMRNENISRDSLLDLRKALAIWHEELVEVPGHENDHDHSHDGHDHSHGHHHTSPESSLTPAEMLAIQEEFASRIDSLGNQLRRLLER